MKNLIYPRQNGKPLMALLMALFLFSCGSDEPDATDPDTLDLVCKAGSNDNCQEIFLTNAGIDCPDGLSSVSERCTGARLATCDNGAGIRWDYFGYDAFQLASEQQTCESMGHTWTSQSDPPVSFRVNVTTPDMSVTTESGRSVTFTLVLTGQPTANVVITPTSSDTGEGTVSPETLTFTSDNWNTPQQLTVTGVNDEIDDGNQRYQITFTVSSEDTNYNNFSLDPVDVTNTDNNTPGITPMVVDSTTSESANDNTGTIRLMLNTQPTANVVITPTSSNTGEGTVSGALTFTTSNWGTEQRITVTGVNDDIIDGDQSYQITFTVMSDDTNYNNFSLGPVGMTNVDNDRAGVTLTPIGSETTEAGGTVTIRVVLAAQPTANVVITPASSDDGEGTVSPETLTFTSDNWNDAQTVTVTGVNDDTDDENQSYQITFTVMSDDTNYNELTVSPVGMTNVDNDRAGVTLTPPSGSPTTESGGTVTIGVVLTAEPMSDVTITFASSDTGEGTVSPETLTFTIFTWNTPQQVTVTGVNDDIDDGDQGYLITFTVMSDDTNYNELPLGPAVYITNTDDDTVAFMVMASPTGNVGEDVGTVTYTVSLSLQPVEDVTVDYAIAGTATLGSDYMLPVSSTSMTTELSGTLSFTPANWNTDQTITLPIENDSIAEDNENITFTLSNPTGGAEFPSQASSLSVTTTIQDNDMRGVKVDTNPMMTGDQNTLTVTEGSSTGGTYTVVLTSQPTGEVTVRVGASAIGDVLVMVPASSTSMTEGALTFTPENPGPSETGKTRWDMPQTVTVTAADDTDLLNDPSVTLTHTVMSDTDTNYNSLPAASVVVTIVEDDKATFTVTGPATENENVGTFNYTVSLSAQPAVDVKVDYTITSSTAGSDDYRVTAYPMSSTSLSTLSRRLIFTPANWDTDQTITLTIENDSIAEDDETITFTLSNPLPDESAALSAMRSLTTTIQDDDTRGVVASKTALSVMEGMTASYTVKLNSKPTGNVTVEVEAPDDGLVLVSIPSTSLTTAALDLTFTTSNWDTPQEVIVAAAEDDDDAVSNEVMLTNTASGGGYTTESATVTVTITDNDTATFMLTGSGTVSEDVGTVTYTVSLSARPAADVTVKYAIGGTATLDSDYMFSVPGTSMTTGGLTFNMSDSGTNPWNTPRTITLTIVDDMIDENDETINFRLSEPTGGAKLPSEAMSFSVTTTIQDNDTRGVKVDTDPVMMGDQSTLTVPEGSSTGGTYTVVLNSEPTGDVTVRVGASGDVGDVLVMAPMSSTSLTTALGLTFTTSNWNMPQTVRVTAADDPDAAIDASVTLMHTVSGADYGSVTASSVMVMITENDTRGVTVSKETLVVPEGGEADYTVVLDSQPTGDVAVTLDGASGDVSVKMPAPIQTESLTRPSLLTFTTSNWDTPQTVTVAAAEDDDKNVDDAVTLTHTVSGADYGGGEVTASSVVVNIIENETATFSVTGPSSVKENVGMATYTVSLSADPGVPVTVGYATTDGTAVVNSDYMMPMPTMSMTTAPVLIFTPDIKDDMGVVTTMGNWRTPQTVDVTIVYDADGSASDDDEETFTFTLSNPSGDAVLSMPASSVTTTIIDLLSVEVSFGTATYSVTEGMTVGVIVTLNKDPRRTVTIPLITADGPGVTSGDYTFPTSVTFMSGETEKTVTFTATDDNEDENRERVRLGFGTPPSRVTVQMVSGNPSTAFVEILDND